MEQQKGVQCIMKVTGQTTLFTNALATINRAILANKERAPYKQIFAASEKLSDGLTVGVAVYKEDPSTPYDYYTVRYVGGTLELIEHGKTDDVDVTWKVSQDYLNDVAEHPERYVESPAKLDLDWLKNRLIG